VEEMIVELQILGIVGLAALLGSIVGLDREFADKPAGLRTHMLVAASAALLVSLANVIVPNLDINPELVRMDPIRMIEAIVAGITFLGAGTIIRQKSGVEGLTTAASLLFVAALGVTVALSQFALAIGLTILNLVILRGIKFFEKNVLNEYGIEFGSDGKKRPSADEQEQEKIHTQDEKTTHGSKK
jgi:putative Mg2+ transporter-C (MgtC) family protein